jgi:hypothetical protein
VGIQKFLIASRLDAETHRVESGHWISSHDPDAEDTQAALG